MNPSYFEFCLCWVIIVTTLVDPTAGKIKTNSWFSTKKDHLCNTASMSYLFSQSTVCPRRDKKITLKITFIKAIKNEVILY